MSNDWAIRRSIGNASEKVDEDGTFIVSELRANNYLRSDDIIGAMNSTQLAEVQAAIDRSDQTRIVAERMCAFFAAKKRLLESRIKVFLSFCVSCL